MATKKITQRRVRRLTEGWLRENLGKRRTAREEWGDADRPGLRVRLGKSGVITWVHYRQVARKQMVLVLGRYPELSLGAARLRLDAERGRARQGLTGLATLESDGDMTVAGLVEKFTASLHSHRRHPGDARRRLDQYVLRRPHGFSSLKVEGVARQAWRAIVEEIVAAGHLTQAQHVFRLLNQMFDFGVELGALQASPFHGLRARTLGAVPAPPRQRTLDVDELRAVLELIDAPCAVDARSGRLALKILLLTGKRTSELLKARWPEVNFEGATWRIPAGNRKGTMHAAIGDEAVPLSAAAVAAFKELRELARGSEWVVASPHRKASLRGHMRETALNKTVYWLLKKRRLNMPRWTPHDARRTARSYWSEKLGITWDLCERLLGHALPTVARTYDTGSYLEQRRDALEKWAAYLERIAGSGATVVALPSGIVPSS
jgi:integrase